MPAEGFFWGRFVPLFFDSREMIGNEERGRLEQHAAKISGQMQTGDVASCCGTLTSKPSWCAPEKDLELVSAWSVH